MAAHNNRTYLIVCLILLPLAAFFSFCRPWTVSADVWETAATIRAVSDDILHPTNPLLDLPGETSPRFTPYTVFWGAMMRRTGMGLFTVVGIAGIANWLLFVTGLGRFVRRQFRSHTLPAYVLVTMLVVWGTGYAEANGYQLALFLHALPLVAIFAYGICFHALASLRAYLDSRQWPELLLYALLSIITFVTHPITAAFGFVAAVAMLLAEADFKRAILFQAVPLLALGAALLWPYFDYLLVLTKGSTEAWYECYLFSGQFKALGAAIVGIPVTLYYGLKKRHLFIVYGLAFCLLIYLMSWAVRIQIGSRFILFAAIFLHLAIASYLHEHNILRWRNLTPSLKSRGFAVVLVLILLIPALWYRAREMKWMIVHVYDPPFRLHTYDSPARPFFFLSDHLGPSDVVMADDTTGWAIPAITGAKLAAQLKGNPLISAEVSRRRDDARAFLMEELSLEERHRLLRKYHVTHILLDRSQSHKWDPSLIRDMPSLGRQEAGQGVIVLYRLRDRPFKHPDGIP